MCIRDRVMVACTDGVGTKLKIAQTIGRHDTVGIDLVAMCVNDAICCGAEPLFFLDYVAMGKDDPKVLEQIVTGISDGCLLADCALLGGETAIMPDMYQEGDYDLAGFCVGVVDKKNLIDGKAIADGDVVIGINSNGIHSNGYSLVRKIVYDVANKKNDDAFDEHRTVAEELLRPTTIYTKAIREVLANYKIKNVIHGIVHVTGGGIEENIERVLPITFQSVSTATVGFGPKYSGGCRTWVGSKPKKCFGSSTWASDWSSSSASSTLKVSRERCVKMICKPGSLVRLPLGAKA